jgi:hypothetical protein
MTASTAEYQRVKRKRIDMRIGAWNVWRQANKSALIIPQVG